MGHIRQQERVSASGAALALVAIVLQTLLAALPTPAFAAHGTALCVAGSASKTGSQPPSHHMMALCKGCLAGDLDTGLAPPMGAALSARQHADCSLPVFAPRLTDIPVEAANQARAPPISRVIVRLA